jgi:hypothetical protein
MSFPSYFLFTLFKDTTFKWNVKEEVKFEGRFRDLASPNLAPAWYHRPILILVTGHKGHNHNVMGARETREKHEIPKFKIIPMEKLATIPYAVK